MSRREISIIAIGDEVLYGYTLNSNSSFIAKELVQRGFFPISHRVIPDSPNNISQIITDELEKGRDVITTGGLGPTADDYTKRAVSPLFHQSLTYNSALLEELQKRYGNDFPTLEEQSLQPEKATLFHNSVGTAPGFLLEDSSLFPNGRLFALPGPPLEMRAVLREVIDTFFPGSPLPFCMLNFVGVSEHEINRCLQKVCPKEVHAGIYPSFSTVRVHLYVEKTEDESTLEHTKKKLSERIRGIEIQDPSLEETIHRVLQEKGWSISTAESCTAGGIAARLASVEGASASLAGSIVTYQTHIKENLLSVPKETVDTFGVVSQEVTSAMARGAKALFNTDIACAVSGFFGPAGGTEQAPVGTVCTTILLPDGLHSETFLFHGTREAICEKTIQAILAKLTCLLLA